MGYSSFSQKFLLVSDWLMKFLVTNILWILFNLPIVYFVLTLLFADTLEKLQLIVFSIAALAPFIFFPATTAMFGVVRQWIIGKNELSLIKGYWKYYKENYVRSMLGGLIIVPIWSAWIFNYVSSAITIGTLYFYFYIAITIFLFTCTVHFFSDTVHFDVKLKDSLIKTIFITIGNIHYALLLSALTGMLLYFSIKIIPLIIPLFLGSIVAYLAFYFYYRIILKAQTRLEKLDISNQNETSDE